MMNNNFMNMADFYNEDKVYSPGEGYVDRESARYVPLSQKRATELSRTYTRHNNKPIKMVEDKTGDVLKELDQKIINAEAAKQQLDEESSDSIAELTELNKKISMLESETNQLKTSLFSMESDLKSLNTENEEQCSIRTAPERVAFEAAEKKLADNKTEYDSIVIPERLPEPRRNASKSERNEHTLKVQAREDLISRKNLLTNQRRNRELDVETTKMKLHDAIYNPKVKLDKKLKAERIEYDTKIAELNKLRHKSRGFQVLQAKKDFVDKEIKDAKEAKHRYNMRGMSVISKNGIVNYDDNGFVIPKKPSYDKMYEELRKLEENPPQCEEKGINYNVKSEYDFTMEYLKDRINFIRSLESNKDFIEIGNDKYIKEGIKEIAELKVKAADLKKRLYNGIVWITTDTVKLNEMKQEIFNKYKYNYAESSMEKHSEEKTPTYTWNDYIKSIR